GGCRSGAGAEGKGKSTGPGASRTVQRKKQSVPGKGETESQRTAPDRRRDTQRTQRKRTPAPARKRRTRKTQAGRTRKATERKRILSPPSPCQFRPRSGPPRAAHELSTVAGSAPLRRRAGAVSAPSPSRRRRRRRLRRRRPRDTEGPARARRRRRRRRGRA